MRNTQRLFAIATMAVASLAAAAPPNMSGTWKINNSKSEFGQFPPPASFTQKVVHEDPKMKVSADMGDFSWDANYTTDGKESKNDMGGNTSTSVAKWDGSTLLIDTKGKFGDNEVTIKDKWTLSEDGKTLTINRRFSSSFGDVDQKLVMEKQ